MARTMRKVRRSGDPPPSARDPHHLPYVNEPGLPPLVRELIDRALPSMDHVVVLLLLHRTSPRAWHLHEVAGELRLTSDVTTRCLTQLAETGVATITSEGSSPAYRLAQQDPRLLSAVEELAVMYNTRPVTLVRALYDRKPDPVRSFADAFRLRGDS